MPMLSQRGNLHLGYRCNARCGFCYYQGRLDNPVKNEATTDQLRARLTALRREGAVEVEFTGGEPTIRPDLAELAAVARDLGFVNISVISNGLRLANPHYVDQLVSAGVNDFLFSIHGHDADVHEAQTRIPGSFTRVMQAVRNAQAAGARCRSTTTINGRNHRYAAPMLGLFLELGMECIHFAVFSPVAGAGGADKRLFVSYTDAAASLKCAIDRFEDRLPPLSVKYIPFCLMQGYEKYVMNLYQQNYDPDDWNYYFSNKIRRAHSFLMRTAFDAMSLAGSLLVKDWSVPLQNGFYGLKVYGFTRLVELLRKKRLEACVSCAYDMVCDHVWRDYIDHFGVSEFVSVPGSKLKEPAWSYVMAHYRASGSRVGRGMPGFDPERVKSYPMSN